MIFILNAIFGVQAGIRFVYTYKCTGYYIQVLTHDIINFSTVK